MDIADTRVQFHSSSSFWSLFISISFFVFLSSAFRDFE
jgi:hypothetical protein